MGSVVKPVLAWLGAVAVLSHVGPGPTDVTSLAGPGRSASIWLSSATAQPEAALTVLAAGAAWLLLAWLAVAFLVVVGSAGSRSDQRWRTQRWCRRAAHVLVPRTMRHGLEAALGLGVAALTATPALAAPAAAVPSVPSVDRAPVTSVRLAPLPAVPAPVLAPATAATPTADAAADAGRLPSIDRSPPPRTDDPALTGALPATDEVVVHRGDCLWDLVRRSLGPTASDADVARSWPRWYAHNRTAIGADPDLLLPGTVLTPPPAA